MYLKNCENSCIRFGSHEEQQVVYSLGHLILC